MEETRVDGRGFVARKQLHWRRLAMAAILAWLWTTPLLAQSRVPWTILSTTTGDLPPANGGEEQTTCVVGDVDQDGVSDFFITERSEAPAIILYRRSATGWDKYVIEAGAFQVDAGGDVADIDGDGDLDLALGQDVSGGNAWWWENPFPALDPSIPWTRRLIRSGGSQQHDQRFGDFDGDGRIEYATWGNLARVVEIFEIPQDPTLTPWSLVATVAFPDIGFFPEGMDVADIDLDGKLDILAGGHWIRHEGGNDYSQHPIDATYVSSRIIGGQFIDGDRPEVVMSSGDSDGPLSFYRYDGISWLKTDLLPQVIHGHSLEAGDFDRDGHLDIFTAEMGDPGAGVNCKAWILWGDGAGNFIPEVISTGVANHMSRVADLDGDGDLDIVMKPFHLGAPQVNVLLNGTQLKPSLDRWEKHLLDGAMPWQPILVTARDIDGDGKLDIIAGGWWYRNPGAIDSVWVQHTVGGNLKNMAWVDDFDGDGDLDIFGTDGDPEGGTMSWARNDGSGSFTVFDNIGSGHNTYFQGAVGGVFSGSYQVVMQWQGGESALSGVEAFAVPANPGSGPWPKTILSPASIGEDLSQGDIDGDGDLDLFQGSGWLRNEGGGVWTHIPVATFTELKGGPDRNELVDIDNDGDLDAVVGFSHFTDPDTHLLWLEQPADPTQPWPKHVVVDGVWGGYSLDAKDVDGDGDVDIVLGEHRGATRTLLYENVHHGTIWIQHLVDAGGIGIDHHDGTQLFDLDGDGDLDIVSIGWDNDKLWIFKNTTAVLPDTEVPSPPTNLLATPIASRRVDLSWSRSTDNRLVTGYQIWRDGIHIASTTEPFYSDPGLAPETQYSYRVLALDAAANKSAPSASAEALTPSLETEPPTVPGNLVATPFSTKVVLRWDAAEDNRAVAGYRIYRGGLPIAATTALDFADKGLAKNTAYVYAVAAFDAEGNESNPALNTVSASTRTLSPLLAGYAFEEQLGLEVLDASGNGNDALLEAGTTRNSSGQFGSAVEFNGGGGRVNLGPFDLDGSAITWALWFKADDFGIGDARLVSKSTGINEDDHYFMISTFLAEGVVRLRLRLKTTDGGTTTLLSSGPALTSGVWTHVAATYDGNDLKLYQDGEEVGSRAKNGALVSAPQVETWIGANPDGSKFFDGVIDEVRCYNIALSVAEIQSAMNSPLMVLPDTDRPSAPTNLVATATSSSEVVLSWTAATDNVRVVAYRIYRDGGLVDNSRSLDHIDSGLTSETTYTYQVSAIDLAGNESDLSQTAQATTQLPGESGGVPPHGLVLWLRSDVGTTLAGTAVTHWSDQSGRSHHATQEVLDHCPTLVTDYLNGLPVLRFDGVNDFLVFTQQVNGLSGLSLFLVAANTQPQIGGPAGAERAALFWNETAGWGTVHLTPFQSQVNLRFGTTQSDNQIIYRRPSSAGANFSLTEAIKDGATDSLYINGLLVLQQEGKLSTIAGCTDLGNLGRGYNDDTFFAGDVAEVLVYTRALSPAERTAVEQYLEDKYRLTTPGEPPGELRAEYQDGAIVVSWLACAGCVLQRRTLLGAGAEWSAVDAPVRVEENRRSVELPADGAQQFFRLQGP